MIEKIIQFGKALRTEDKEHTKAVSEHFQSQTDLFTQCPKCKARLSGAIGHILSHKCDFGDLLGV